MVRVPQKHDPLYWKTKCEIISPKCSQKHRRTGNFLPGGGGNPFAQKIIASCPNVYETVERKLGPCNKIGRTGIWKWLDTVFQSQYLPSLSINFVATNKDLEKIATTVVLGKEENLAWSGLQWHRSCQLLTRKLQFDRATDSLLALVTTARGTGSNFHVPRYEGWTRTETFL